MLKKCIESSRTEKARSASANEDGLQWPTLAERLVAIEVLAKNFYVFLLGNSRRCFMGIEITVGTFLHTPGDMDVKA